MGLIKIGNNAGYALEKLPMAIMNTEQFTQLCGGNIKRGPRGESKQYWFRDKIDQESQLQHAGNEGDYKDH